MPRKKTKTKIKQEYSSSISSNVTTSSLNSFHLKLDMYMRIRDIKPKIQNFYIHGRVEKRSKLTMISKGNLLSFYLILADDSAEIKIVFFGKVAAYFDRMIKEGKCYIFKDFKLYKNRNIMNHTLHKYQITVQQSSSIKEQPDKRLTRMERHFYIRRDRDILELLDLDIGRNVLYKSQPKRHALYDLEGVVFKVEEKRLDSKNKDQSRLNVWICNGEHVISISFIETNVQQFKSLFSENIWNMLKKGFPSIEQCDVKGLNCFFRNVTLSYFDKYKLDFMPEIGEVFIKHNIPSYKFPMKPRKMINFGKNFLELPGHEEEIESIKNIIEDNMEGTFIIAAKIGLGKMNMFSYPVITGDEEQRKLSCISPGRYYCASNRTVYYDCEDLFRIVVTLKDSEGMLNALIFDDVAKKIFGQSANDLKKLAKNEFNKLISQKNDLNALILIHSKLDNQDVVPETILNFIVKDILII